MTVMVDNAFASHTGVGGVQAFTLASNLLSVPQTIIAGAVSTVYYPVFGALWVTDQKEASLASVWRSARLTVFALLPVIVFFVVAGVVVVRILYQHGTFDEEMTRLVSNAVAGLAIGQLAYACALLLRQFLLVAGAPWAILQGAVVFLSVKWVGNTILTPRFGVPGIALSSSFAAIAMCSFLVYRVIDAARTWRRETVH